MIVINEKWFSNNQGGLFIAPKVTASLLNIPLMIVPSTSLLLTGHEDFNPLRISGKDSHPALLHRSGPTDLRNIASFDPDGIVSWVQQHHKIATSIGQGSIVSDVNSTVSNWPFIRFIDDDNDTFNTFCAERVNCSQHD